MSNYQDFSHHPVHLIDPKVILAFSADEQSDISYLSSCYFFSWL